MLFEQLRKAFSGFRMDVDALAAEGDLVIVRATMTGTHVGEFMGIPPSGKEIRVPLGDWTRVRSGKGVEHWGVADMSGLML
jgi:predicted ester cyclase